MNRQELVEKMLDSFNHTTPEQRDTLLPSMCQRMDAALSVAVEELLKEATQEEVGSTWVSPPTVQRHVANIFAARRAQLERVKTPEERVTIERGEMDSDESWVTVYQDGEEVCCNMVRRHAEIYRLGLIQQLKDSA